uniref:Uncharacterized protein n=1 Tax=Tanacetum cinerariifolium TaxID=118510 RepID=A0A6L2JFE5_TANCI|nr:hypothetical protein [Tanacetum cinerariifolium]
MLTRSMAAKLTAASASECLFIDFLFEIEPKKDDKEISICKLKYTRDLLKKYENFDSSSVKIPMAPPNNLGPDLADEDDLRKAYEKCNDISQENHALIDTFLKEGSDKDYELNLSMALISTQEYMQKVVKDVGKHNDFKSEAWVSATNYVTTTGGTVTGCLRDIDNNLKKGKLDQVVAIVKSCSSNALGDLTVTMKDLSCAIHGSIHYKRYLNITKKNVVKVFRKDTVPESDSGYP